MQQQRIRSFILYTLAAVCVAGWGFFALRVLLPATLPFWLGLLIAAVLRHEPVEAVTPQQRDEAKVITLGLCYGMGVESMAAKLGIPPKSALELRTQILRVGRAAPLLRRNTAASSGS